MRIVCSQAQLDAHLYQLQRCESASKTEHVFSLVDHLKQY